MGAGAGSRTQHGARAEVLSNSDSLALGGGTENGHFGGSNSLREGNDILSLETGTEASF